MYRKVLFGILPHTSACPYSDHGGPRDRPCGSLWRTLTFSGLNQPLQPVGQPWIHPSKARPWRAPEQHIPHAPFLHAASTGLWACEPFSSGKAGFLMHTDLASVHPRPCGPGTELCAALNRPGASQGGLFPTTWQELSLTHHGPGQAQGGPAHLSLPEDKDITGPGLGSVFKALPTPMQRALFTHLLLVLC